MASSQTPLTPELAALLVAIHEGEGSSPETEIFTDDVLALSRLGLIRFGTGGTLALTPQGYNAVHAIEDATLAGA